jgi:hypothetical protein
MNVTPAARPQKSWGQIFPKVPKGPQLPQLPIVLRGGGMILNLPAEEARERYGLWKTKILSRSCVYGQILEPGDTAELTGDVVFTLVCQGTAEVSDPKMKEEADIINKAAEFGLPQKIRELASFAMPKKDRWSTRLTDSEPGE